MALWTSLPACARRVRRRWRASRRKPTVRLLGQRGVTRTGTRSRPHQPKLRRQFTHSQFFRTISRRYFEKTVRPCGIPQMLQRACSWLRSHNTTGVRISAMIPRTIGWDQSMPMVHLLNCVIIPGSGGGAGAGSPRAAAEHSMRRIFTMAACRMPPALHKTMVRSVKESPEGGSHPKGRWPSGPLLAPYLYLAYDDEATNCMELHRPIWLRLPARTRMRLDGPSARPALL